MYLLASLRHAQAHVGECKGLRREPAAFATEEQRHPPPRPGTARTARTAIAAATATDAAAASAAASGSGSGSGSAAVSVERDSAVGLRRGGDEQLGFT